VQFDITIHHPHLASHPHPAKVLRNFTFFCFKPPFKDQSPLHKTQIPWLTTAWNKLFGRWDMKAKALPKAFKEGIDLSLQPKMENREEEENMNISDCVATLK
jgi:hypothetical protein